jgi:formylmethanofuran--tetrahydromethanopterin N-formyltransferase
LARICITARDDRRLSKAANGVTALPSTVFGEAEGGIEKWISGSETPDGRDGAIVQIWVNLDQGKSKLEYELAKRLRQGVLVVPTTSVFNALNRTEKIDVMDRVGHCGDGYEEFAKMNGRAVIKIPIMMGEFIIERYLGYSKGVMGGNVWFLCDSEESAMEAGDKAVDAINKVDGAITPFDVCAAGSKPETDYPEIGPTTNHPYCPTLRDKIEDSRVPVHVASIPEIVIDGISVDAVKEAMRAAIRSVRDVDGVIRISAGNYGGKVGRYKIYLRDIVEDEDD